MAPWAHAPAPAASTSVAASTRLRVDDAVVLAIVTACGLEASSKLLHVQNPIVQTLLVVAWSAAAARRLVAWRHGQGAVRFDRLYQQLTVVACTAPLFAMPLLNPSASNWSGGGLFSLPSWLQASGGLLIVMSLLVPFCAPPESSAEPRPLISGAEFYGRAVGFILLAVSPWFAAAVCVSFVFRKRLSSNEAGLSPVASAPSVPASSRRVYRRDGTLDPVPA
jgi:hypothetical protein